MLRSGVLFRPDEPPPAATPPPPAADPPPAATPPANMIPQDRLNEVLRQAQDSQRRAEAAEARATALEDEKKSDLEKAQAEAARNKQAADDANAAVAKMKRDNAVRAAATLAGSISPDAVVALVESRNVEINVDDPASITKAIDAMKGTKEAPGPDAALFGETGAPAVPPSPFGLPAGGTTPPPGTPPANGSEDPKMELGKGILAALASRGR